MCMHVNVREWDIRRFHTISKLLLLFSYEEVNYCIAMFILIQNDELRRGENSYCLKVAMNERRINRAKIVQIGSAQK